MPTHVRVIHDRDEYITRRADKSDSWDRDDTAAEITIHGIEVIPESGYRDITVPFDVEFNKSYLLLWADYNTGDSFGHDANQVEFIDLFQTQELAVKARQDFLDSSGFNCNYTREDGSRISCHVPWHGYFESLNSLNIEVVRVTRLSY